MCTSKYTREYLFFVLRSLLGRIFVFKYVPKRHKKCNLSAAGSLLIDRPSADINTEHDMKIEAIQCFLSPFWNCCYGFHAVTAAMFIKIVDAEMKAQIRGKLSNLAL